MGYKYKVNHEYFDYIDSEEKAYYLGLLYADGCICQPNGNRQLNITIALQEEDGDILDKFSTNAGGGQKSLLNPPAVIKNNWKKRAVVKIVSDKMGKKLIEWGCAIRKSREGMTFPAIEEKYFKDFIRGFMDGDGSVIIKKINYKYKRKTSHFIKNAYIANYKLRIAFASTDRDFLLKIAQILSIQNPYLVQKLRSQLVYTLWIENVGDTSRVLNYLYKDATIYFKRKHDKFLEYNKLIKSQAIDTSIEGLTTT